MKRPFLLFFLCSFFLFEAGALIAQSGGALYTFPIGVQGYTYRKSFPVDVEATLDTIQALGITELEGSNPRGTTPEEFRKMADARNIKIPATGGGYDAIVNNTQEIIDKAKILGASYVMVAWIPHENGNFNIENAKKAVTDFNKAGKTLKENGLTFCYHVHGYEFRPHGNGTLFDYIAENTNPEYVSFELDIFWTVFGGADPVELMEKYGDRWKLMHLKDLKKGVVGDHTGGTSNENDVPLGTGQIDIPNILKVAKKIGIQHYFIEDESDNVSESVPQSIAYLKSLKE